MPLSQQRERGSAPLRRLEHPPARLIPPLRHCKGAVVQPSKTTAWITTALTRLAITGSGKKRLNVDLWVFVAFELGDASSLCVDLFSLGA